jgi:hypothetical protein
MHKFDHYFKINGFDVYDKLNERITSLLNWTFFDIWQRVHVLGQQSGTV